MADIFQDFSENWKFTIKADQKKKKKKRNL